MKLKTVLNYKKIYKISKSYIEANDSRLVITKASEVSKGYIIGGKTNGSASGPLWNREPVLFALLSVLPLRI